MRNRYARALLRRFALYTDGRIGLPDHPTASNVRDHVGPDVFDDYFTFGFVRNPWDWQVSLYFYMLQTPEHFQHDIVTGFSSFQQYLEWRVRSSRRLQKEFFTNSEGEIIVDFIGRFENLAEDFQTACAGIGLQGVRLPHSNPSRHGDYRAYYDDYTRELVSQHFREDIELFGYTFEDFE